MLYRVIAYAGYSYQKKGFLHYLRRIRPEQGDPEAVRWLGYVVAPSEKEARRKAVSHVTAKAMHEVPKAQHLRIKVDTVSLAIDTLPIGKASSILTPRQYKEYCKDVKAME